MNKRERNSTPIEFRDVLIKMARSATWIEQYKRLGLLK